MAEKLVIRNIGLLLSGALENPILDADTVVAEDGKIAAFGKEADCNTAGADVVIDAKGVALVPGLIDKPRPPGVRRLDAPPEPAQLDRLHHAWRGDDDDIRWPRSTSPDARAIPRVWWPSASPRSAPSRPFRRAGSRSTPARRSLRQVWRRTISGSSPRPESSCWARSASGGVKTGEEAKKMVGWARKYGIQSTIHTGGPSIPGSGLIDARRRAGDRARYHRPHKRRAHPRCRATRSPASASSARPGSRSSITATRPRPCSR